MNHRMETQDMDILRKSSLMDRVHAPIYLLKSSTRFYHRFTLVLIGLAAAAVIQLFPSPPSATRAASGALSRIIVKQNNFYSEVVSSWLNVHNPDSYVQFRTKTAWEKSVTEMYELLAAVVPRIAMVKYEISSSPYTSANLMPIYTSISRIQETLSVLGGTIPKLKDEDDLRRRLELQTGFLETRTISDVMTVFAVVTGSLQTGDPLPQILPTPLLARVRRPTFDHTSLLSKELMHKELVRYPLRWRSITDGTR